MRNYLMILGFVLTILLIGKSFISVDQPVSTSGTSDLTPQQSAGNVTVDVTPLSLTPGQSAKFEVSFTTHSGNPVYDLKNQSELTDDLGQIYYFTSWDGNSEGHHVLGNITFTPLGQKVSSVTLSIKAVDGQDRTFNWRVK